METSISYSYKSITLMALPIIVSQSVVLLGGMLDLAFIAPFGTEAIAAVAVANAICSTAINFLEGFRLGTTVLVSKAAGDGNAAKITAVVHTGLFLALVLGLVDIMAAPRVSALVYGHIGSAAVADYGQEYLTVWLWAIPVILLGHVLVGLFRGLHDTTAPLYGAVAACCCNAVFDYLFIYGGFGLPGQGVKGAAWATMAAVVVEFVLLAVLARKRPLTACYMQWQSSFFAHVKEYVTLSAEIGLNTGFTLLALLVFVGILKDAGTVALAVHQITLQVFTVVYLPAGGFLAVAAMLLPRLLGEGRGEFVTATVTRIGRLSFGVGLILSGGLFAGAPLVAGFFSPADPTVAAGVVKTLTLVCVAQLFSCWYMVLRGALTGCRDTRFIVCEGLVSGYMVFLPLAYFFAVHRGGGVFGGYEAFLLWCAVDCLVLAIRFYVQQVWRDKLAHSQAKI